MLHVLNNNFIFHNKMFNHLKSNILFSLVDQNNICLHLKIA